MNNNIQAGQSFSAKDTATNRSCGINPHLANGKVCLVKDELVSIYLQKGNNIGFLEAKLPLELFVANFSINSFSPINKGYVKSKHYVKNYPNDYINK